MNIYSVNKLLRKLSYCHHLTEYQKKCLILPHKEDNWGRLRACSCPLGMDLVSVTFSEMLDSLGCRGKDWFSSNIQLWADSLLKAFACFVNANDLSGLVITCEGQAVASGKVNVIWSAHFLHLGKKGFLWGRFCGWFLLVAEAITFGMKFYFLISHSSSLLSFRLFYLSWFKMEMYQAE